MTFQRMSARCPSGYNDMLLVAVTLFGKLLLPPFAVEGFVLNLLAAAHVIVP
jgi:hypothetical protein